MRFAKSLEHPHDEVLVGPIHGLLGTAESGPASEQVSAILKSPTVGVLLAALTTQHLAHFSPRLTALPCNLTNAQLDLISGTD